MAPEVELLDIAQAAALLNVSEMSLRRWTNTGQLPCLRIGGRRERRFRRADLLAFAEGQSTPKRAGGGHLCSLYTNDVGRTRHAAAALADGLQSGSVCFLAAQPDVAERVLAQLARDRASLRNELDAKRLVVSTYAERRTAQLQYWKTQFETATRAGTHSLRVVGDVSGAGLARRNDFAEVLEYEADYARLSRRFPVATACLYDARAYSGVETAELLRAHPDLFRVPVDHLVS